MPGTSTGCGLHSMNRLCPAVAAAWTAFSNLTGLRRFSYQYSASISSPATSAPVTVENHGISPATPRIPASPAARSCLTGSTSGECEA